MTRLEAMQRVVDHMTEAELATLRAENARLREALEPFAALVALIPDSVPDGAYQEEMLSTHGAITVGTIRLAAAALAAKEPGHEYHTNG
jgi:hypothetical protein